MSFINTRCPILSRELRPYRYYSHHVHLLAVDRRKIVVSSIQDMASRLLKATQSWISQMTSRTYLLESTFNVSRWIVHKKDLRGSKQSCRSQCLDASQIIKHELTGIFVWYSFEIWFIYPEKSYRNINRAYDTGNI